MSKKSNFLENKVVPFAAKIGAQRHLAAIRDGMALLMPIMIVGSLALILMNLPIQAYQDFMTNLFPYWKKPLLIVHNGTWWILGLATALGISYKLAEALKIDRFTTSLITLSCYLIQLKGIEEGWPPSIKGTNADTIFTAIIMGLLIPEIIKFFIKKDIVIKMPDGVPPSVSKGFMAVVPALASIFFAVTIRMLCTLTSHGDLTTLVNHIVGKPIEALTGSLIGAIVAVLLIHLLWTLGLHGANIVMGVMGPIWLKMLGDNTAAFAAGEALPNIVCTPFFEIFVYLGGSGATLVLAFMLAFLAKSKQLKTLGRLALPAGIFNINEPIIFGLPIVLNPVIAIPFVITPVVLTIINYVAISTGIVPRLPGLVVPWTSPIIMSGYLATGGHISGVILQLVNFAVAFAIYFVPFKIWDRRKVEEEAKLTVAETNGVTR